MSSTPPDGDFNWSFVVAVIVLVLVLFGVVK